MFIIHLHKYLYVYVSTSHDLRTSRLYIPFINNNIKQYLKYVSIFIYFFIKKKMFSKMYVEKKQYLKILKRTTIGISNLINTSINVYVSINI
jgi:hypothetical protein